MKKVAAKKPAPPKKPVSKPAKSAQHHPLILRLLRLIDAFTKSDDERDFYIDKKEGFLLFVDLNKTREELAELQTETTKHEDRYCMIPKMTYYEVKKIMEGFVNEKVWDIDTKEKLLDIIGSKNARENFLEFIWDHLTELEKWQQYYVERMRVRIIEWLRHHELQFVFEEDLDLGKTNVEKLKSHFLDTKVPKDVAACRDAIEQKAQTYYSLEALNPRPKRGRPPKQTAKVAPELSLSSDLYLTVPPAARPFLFLPDLIAPAQISFSGKTESDEQLFKSKGQNKLLQAQETLQSKLSLLRGLASRSGVKAAAPSWDDDEDDDEDDEEVETVKKPAVKKR